LLKKTIEQLFVRKISQTFTLFDPFSNGQRYPCITVGKFGNAPSVALSNTGKTPQEQFLGDFRPNSLDMNHLGGLGLVVPDIVFDRDQTYIATCSRYFARQR